MMRSCASAAKLRAAGPFFRSASSARFEYGFPPPRIVNSAVVLKASARAEPPQEPALQQLGVEPVGFRSAMLPRYRDTRGMDHMSLDPTRLKPARQPEAG